MKNNIRQFLKEQNWLHASVALLAILITAAMVTFSTNAWVSNLGFLALLFMGTAVIFSKAFRNVKISRQPVNIGLEKVPGINWLK